MEQSLKNKIILIMIGSVIGFLFFIIIFFATLFSVPYYNILMSALIIGLMLLHYVIVVYLAIHKFKLHTNKDILSVITAVIIIQILFNLFYVSISDNSTFDTPKTIDVVGSVVSILIQVVIALAATFVSIKIFKKK